MEVLLLALTTLILVLESVLCAEDGIICEDSFCRNYVFDTGCTNPLATCANSGSSALWLLSPTMCNCCEYCIPLYAEGASCSLGGNSDGLTVGRCGASLTCQSTNTAAVCTRMESNCHALQDDYDRRLMDGTVGFLEERPECDDKGNFAPVLCTKTHTCFCQSEDGERLFGEALYRDPRIKDSMKCECSRRHNKVAKNIYRFVSYPVIGPICSEKGGFEPVQCLEDRCFCVDEITGAIDTAEFIDLRTQPVSDLSCFIESDRIEISNEADNTYTTSCLKQRAAMIEKIKESVEMGYIVDYFTTVADCLPDGSYTRVKVDSDGSKHCVDSSGNKIGNYSAEPGYALYDETDCKCAQTNNLMVGLVETPVCCANGNFRPIQCRRGYCYCVDKDGKQTSVENENLEQLPCYTEDWLVC